MMLVVRRIRCKDRGYLESWKLGREGVVVGCCAACLEVAARV